MGVLLSLVITFVVLMLATWNWWVSLLGLVNIVGISIVFLGLHPGVWGAAGVSFATSATRLKSSEGCRA